MQKNVLSTTDASAVLEPVLQQVAALGYDAAKGLASVEEREVEAGVGTADLTIYRELHDDGAVLVVAQLSVDQGRFLLLFRHGQCFAEGLEFNPAGACRRLREDELYEYT